MKKQSEKDIAERTNVSVSKVDRVLNTISSKTVLRHPTLLTDYLHTFLDIPLVTLWKDNILYI